MGFTHADCSKRLNLPNATLGTMPTLHRDPDHHKACLVRYRYVVVKEHRAR